MADTSTYIRSADAAAVQLSGFRSQWSDELERRFPNVGIRSDNVLTQVEVTDPPVVLSGRSIYYGLVLYVSDQLGSLWLAIALQAALVSTCILLTIRRLSGADALRTSDFLIMALTLAVASPVAYFASYLMPDVFSGLSIIALGHLLTSQGRKRSYETLFWTIVLTSGLLFHTSNLLVTIGLLCLTILSRTFGLMTLGWRRLLPVVMALVIAMGGEALFGVAVERATGEPPVRPPFLTARLVADGPGREFLIETCPESGFMLCRFADRLPADSDYFLWSATSPPGVFSALPHAERRELAAEQTRFVAAVIASRPFEVLQSSLIATFKQALHIGLGEFNYHPSQSDFFEKKLPPRIMQDLKASAAYKQAMPVRLVEGLTIASTLVFAAWLAWVAVKRRNEQKVDPDQAFIFICIAGIVLNIIICGALSTPHDRYLMRVLWIIPVLGVGVLRAARHNSAIAPKLELHRFESKA